jgi:hypothetical protein
MKKASPILAVTLVFVMAFTACSSAWLNDVSKYINLAAPAVLNIIEIIAIAKGTAPDAALIAKINADSAALSKLAEDFASASATSQPAIQPQLDAAFNTFQQDAATVFQLAQVSNPQKQVLISSLVQLVQNTIHQIGAMIPQGRAGKLSASPPISASDFVTKYNATLEAKTGDKKFDSEVSKKKLHLHSKFVRAVSLGLAN